MAYKLLETMDEWRKEHPEKTKTIDEIIKKTVEIEKNSRKRFSPKKLTWKSTTGSIKDKFSY